MKSYRLIFALLLIFTSASLAQTACPVGVAAGSAQCGPSPLQHLPSRSERQEAPITIMVPTGEWLNTWGAMATDWSTGNMGVSVGKISKIDAERQALSECTGLGSKGCEIAVAYRNQCGVIASAKPGTGGLVIFQGGFSVQVATDIAMPKCRAGKSGESCEIVYSDCSKQIFRKY